MKGISPLIASVLLIAITMTLAAILASFVSNYTRQQLSSLPSCVGGNIIFSSADYPKWSVGSITAVIEAENVDLETFTFEVLLVNDTILTSSDTMGTSIPAGGAGTVKSSNLGVAQADISKVRITAGNCPGVKTEWTTIKS